MKKYYLVLALALLMAVSLLACNSEIKPSQTQSTTNADPIETSSNSNFFAVNLVTEPAEIKPHKTINLVFSIQDALVRVVDLKELEIVHEKPLHLIVISEDLSFFNHIHPLPMANGTFAVETEFPFAGKYRLYLDYNPKSVGHRLYQVEVKVAGMPPPPLPLVADTEDTKVFDGVRITMKPEKQFKANEALTLAFVVADERTGQPLTDIEPYLGAFAHFNIANQDQTEYLHAHPLKEAESADARGGPELATRTIFPRPGLYKIWTQFQRKGKVIVAPFVVNVAEGAAQAPAAIAKAEDGVQKIKITVSENGYQPANLQLKRGTPTQLIFYRTDEKNCGYEVLISELGIRKDLPVGKEVTIDFTPNKDGAYEFTCGMGMLRGSLVITN